MGTQPERRKPARQPLYIETLIHAPLDRVWQLTQDAGLHPRWDLRFSRIVPVAEDSQGQLRFRYEFRLPLYVIRGTGTSLGHRHRDDGQATSVLKFDTADPLSPIGAGAGYWRYIPTEAGVRFITGYNYEPGMRFVGKLFDRAVIRPALGWATAISFDRLRLWAESEVDPQSSRNRWFADAILRGCTVWGAAVLLRRSVQRRNPLWGVLGVTAAVLAWNTPTHRSVPRAGRTLRVAPDARSARPPATLAGLREPDRE